MMTRCDNCGHVCDEESIIPLEEVPSLLTRIAPGQIVPAGECTKCGALTYLLQSKPRGMVMPATHSTDLQGGAVGYLTHVTRCPVCGRPTNVVYLSGGRRVIACSMACADVRFPDEPTDPPECA